MKGYVINTKDGKGGVYLTNVPGVPGGEGRIMFDTRQEAEDHIKDTLNLELFVVEEVEHGEIHPLAPVANLN